MAEASDELMHPTGDHPAWSESYYFNFVDPRNKIAMFTRMGFRPGSGWADALHVVYLEGKRVAFTYGRRDIEGDLGAYDGDLNVGHLSINCQAPFKNWKVAYTGPAQDIVDAAILLTPSKERPEGWFEPAELAMNVDFRCTSDPHYAAQGEHGHFEQSGHVTGEIRLGDEVFKVDGYGVRDKSWGPRDWGAGSQAGSSQPADTDGPAPFVNWFSMNFGEAIALGGSCFREADGVLRGKGWLLRDNVPVDLDSVTIATRYADDSILHESVILDATTSEGEAIRIEGSVLNVCPTKIPFPGGAIFVNEGLAEFRWGERTGFGIAEHWHAVRRN
ncbi:MAG: hypothetical protein AAGE43_12245 [Pseudomonadota bacterium]